jgi:hypothetical protein
MLHTVTNSERNTTLLSFRGATLSNLLEQTLKLAKQCLRHATRPLLPTSAVTPHPARQRHLVQSNEEAY